VIDCSQLRGERGDRYVRANAFERRDIRLRSRTHHPPRLRHPWKPPTFRIGQGHFASGMIRTANFGFLAAHDSNLVTLGGQAERYFRDDPPTCLIKLRQLAELLRSSRVEPFLHPPDLVCMNGVRNQGIRNGRAGATKKNIGWGRSERRHQGREGKWQRRESRFRGRDVQSR
jgi:hypothetical protein